MVDIAVLQNFFSTHISPHIMSISTSLVASLLTTLIVAVIGGIITSLFRFARIISPTKQLWGFKSPKEAIICVAVKKFDVAEYKKPLTGIGQVKAIAHIATSLNKAYRNVDLKNILSSEEQIGDRLEKDIIVLGGTKTNKIAENFFEELNKDYDNVANQEKNGEILWLKTNKQFNGKIENEEVKKDYGLIIRMNNIWSSHNKTKLILLAGCHTYGTIAAAKFFCERVPLYLRIYSIFRKNYALLISCNVSNGYPTKLKLEGKNFFSLKRKK